MGSKTQLRVGGILANAGCSSCKKVLVSFFASLAIIETVLSCLCQFGFQTFNAMNCIYSSRVRRWFIPVPHSDVLVTVMITKTKMIEPS